MERDEHNQYCDRPKNQRYGRYDGLDFVNLGGVFRSPSIVNTIPIFFKNKEPPMIRSEIEPILCALVRVAGYGTLTFR